MSPNNLPGPGDLPVPDPEPELPQWAIDDALEVVMTNDRLYDFVMKYHYEQFCEVYHAAIRKAALHSIADLDDKS